MNLTLTLTCDGCATTTLPIAYPLPGGRPERLRIADAALKAGWHAELNDLWLCPSCAATTNLGAAEAVTETMW